MFSPENIDLVKARCLAVAKRGDKNVPILYERKEECCGCTACCAICPQSAISMIEDEEGFEYPQIDAEKCVACRMCLRVCPVKAKLAVQKSIS